jgi:pimeloyl-ACP methyl ester carboxylesterase
MTRARRLFLVAAAAVFALTPVYLATALEPAETPGSTEAERVAAAETAAQDAEEAATATRARMDAADIVDLPVSFTVENVNRSLASCPVDGETYTIRGHLTAPRSVLEQPDGRAVTLYQHDIGSGEWFWRLDAEGFHVAEELAQRGQASLTVDRLGYGASDQPHGTATCLGGGADIAHQIVEQLRAGDYTAEGGDAAAFDSVFLAAQGNGAQLAQIAAYSFGDIDGLVLMDWTDLGLNPEINAPFFAALQPCLVGGAEGADGYAWYDQGEDAFREANFVDAEPEVVELAVPLQSRHPCGDMVSQLGGVMADVQHIPSIDVPVLFFFGEEDSRVGGPEDQRALFTGTDDTELVTVPGAGHYVVMSRQAPVLHDALADWLTSHSG